ncbi:UDP-N-acetylglucosamine 2-epimerase [Pollutimonas thiosulfatoxidans]|uniref:UDP-N-acetylglucosamine 2-epimerase (Hydrolyzing) n=1 Tax=Pollutimonas thiosulfatoxidans TaxID=2028345 RepID=A0A410GEJ4_9BURK|nr:UDP-N-acetylglucosamine 2-epimerase [Pollutimonas thiosulfatoxidans]QAA94714.1 UDP-N-acetylglucosamine 2-epimerase (hydrolyzing) [Pollutimonas thiosulfatoxidans]
MIRTVAVFTGTRAEYGLLYWLLKDIQACADFDLRIIAGGMHFSPEFGETWRQIEEDGFHIDAKVELLLSSNSSVGVVKSMGVGMIGFADALDRLRPDILLVLGDRFETIAIAQSALIMQIPIGHIHGGEITEGAYDDAIRHAITKMASFHFVAAEPYRERVVQMGEQPDRVLCVGAVGLDHITRSTRLTLHELATSLRFDLRRPYFLVTYHPVTAANEDPVSVFKCLLEALDFFPDYQVIITYPNADNGGRYIIPLLKQYAEEHPSRILAIASLGSERYLSAMSYAAAVVGNSSSGIIEAPALNRPTVNIGVRQEGRLASASVVNCGVDLPSIRGALNVALSEAHSDAIKKAKNPYGQGDAAAAIVQFLASSKFDVPKKFYDLE